MKKIIFVALLAICSIIMGVYFYEKNSIEYKIIKAIDQQCMEQGECDIFLPEIMKFKWDTVSIFITGGDWLEISHVLGLSYRNTELQDGIIFSNNGKVVKVYTSCDYASNTNPKLSFWIERIEGEPYYRSYSYNNAVLHAKKIKLEDGRYRYILIA